MIYLITGLMASGKSTISRLLAERLPMSVHLRGDVFRKMVVSGRADMSKVPTREALSQLDLRYRLTVITAKEYHAAGFDVVMQDNYYGEKLPLMLGLLEPDPVFTVVLCPGVDTIKARESARNKNGYTGFAVETLYRNFMSGTPHIGLWVDNGSLTPKETVDIILKEATP